MSILTQDGRGSMLPPYGVGIGLRSTHYQHILEHRPNTPWFEVLTDNYMGDGGLPLHYLEQVRQHYPITFHGVGLSLGSTDALNQDYLKRLKQRINEFQPAWVSDHLSWSVHGQHHVHDLLPLPYTDESLQHLIKRISQVQDYLGQQLVVENASTYLEFNDSQMSEAEFVCAIAEGADCKILLDINNIYVSAYNHGFDAHEYVLKIPPQRVQEIHLAGYSDEGTHLLDTHGALVHEPVWDLYEKALIHLGDVPTLIEWDTDIPEYSVLEAEAHKAEQLRHRALQNAA